MNEEKLQELIKLFNEAVSHLEYCGYGDAWERECAEYKNLPERLEAMQKYLETLEATTTPR